MTSLHKTPALIFLLLFFWGGISISESTAAVPDEPDWHDKVEPGVFEQLSQGEQAEFILFLTRQADLTPARLLKTKEEKGQFVFNTLTQTARETQPSLLTELHSLGISYRSFWVANMVWVSGDAQHLETLAQRQDIARVFNNPHVHLEDLPASSSPTLSSSPEGIEWNISKVNAPNVWHLGFTGQGVVIGGQDTGYDWDHPAIKVQYRGWDGAIADHDYNWHDAIHDGGGICGADSPVPCDDHWHGTHTMGTMVGDDGGANQIGIAPSAKWIGCRNMDQGVGSPTTYSECYEWFIAPTNLKGKNPDPTKAPHVINNSWSCPYDEGCTTPNILKVVVENVRAAGILTTHSAGNAGPYCKTVREPAATYDASFTVGAVNSKDTIASFSSRGPVSVDGSYRLKPDIVAPGVGVRSANLGGGYRFSSGTSMASPHVAGLVALLISANPSLAGQVDTLEQIIMESTIQITTTENCGGDTPTSIPNHVYGAGRINALRAYHLAKPGTYWIFPLIFR